MKVGKVVDPVYDVEDLLGLVRTDIRKGIMPMGEIVARIVDGSWFEVLKPLYGKNMLYAWTDSLIDMVLDPCGPCATGVGIVFGELMLMIGHLTGIIVNAQPVIFVPEANKMTQFIKLCNGSNIPIIFLYNVTGFMVGQKTEAQGLIKEGTQLINAVSNSKVTYPPKNEPASPSFEFGFSPRLSWLLP